MVSTSGPKNLDSCDLILVSNGLGLEGICSFTKAIDPRLLIVTELDGSEGDFRLESISQLRDSLGSKTHAIPGDIWPLR